MIMILIAQVRERIDLAFHVMDREYGVTRLLDPEGESQTECVTIRPVLIIYLKRGVTNI